MCKEVATVTETADGHWTSAGIDDEEVIVEEVPRHPFSPIWHSAIFKFTSHKRTR